MPLTINGIGSSFWRVKKTKYLTLWSGSWIARGTFARIIEQIKKTILPTADKLSFQVAKEPAHDGKAGEMQMLNKIRHLCIQEMLN